MSDPFETAAAEARRLIGENAAVIKEHPAMKEVLRLAAGLNALEDMLQQPKSTLGDLLGLGEITSGGSPLSRVKFDDFVGLPALEAAKKYLRKCSDARPFQEIIDAIRAGSGRIESEDDLRTGLSRSTLDIVKMGDRYGLLEHYPHIKRGGKKRKAAGITEEAETVPEGDSASPVLDSE